MGKQLFKKVSSRKFWALIASFVTSVLFAFNVAETDITKIVGVVTAFGSVVVYTLAEASIDRKSAGKDYK